MACTAAPVGQVITLDDGRRAWIRVPRPAGEVEPVGRHWRREVVDGAGRVIATASYEPHSAQTSLASIWVAPSWRSDGLGARLWATMANAAARHGVRWLTLPAGSRDNAATRLLASSGSIVARRVRGDDVALAVLLLPHASAHSGAVAKHASAHAA